MTRTELAAYYLHVLHHVAARLGVPDAELKSPRELVIDIQARDPDVCECVLNLILAYEEWAAVHELIALAGDSATRQALLVEKATARDVKKEALKKALDKRHKR